MDSGAPDGSRRRLVGGIATGLLAGVDSRVIAQAATDAASPAQAEEPAAPVTPSNTVTPWAPRVTGGRPAEKLPSFGEDSPIGRPGQPVELDAIYVLPGPVNSSSATGQVVGSVGGREGP